MTKRIVLCSDDYGQGLTISKGILELVERGRLTAVSCLTTTPEWLEHAEWLKPYQGKVAIGMHFNLTDGQPLSAEYHQMHGPHFFKLPALLKKAFLRQLDKCAIVAECHVQLDRFEAGMGFLPDFIDGHQHVHQFPIIREAFIDVYLKRLRDNHSFIRLVDHRMGVRDVKKMIIYLSGTKSLKKLLLKHQIPYNHSFSGVYEFSKSAFYPHYFRQFIKEIGDQGLIMCHPGLKSDDVSDPIATARYKEFTYFASDTFLADCLENDVKLVTRFDSHNIQS